MSLKNIFITLAIIVFSAILVSNLVNAGNSGDAGSSVQGTDTAKGTEIKFFWLPSGTPCQQQDKILQDMEAKNPNLKVTRIDVTDPASSVEADKYGIRSVPSIVVLDQKKVIVKQFTPGIQTETTLKKYLA
jgi:thiol-disulfide isomerase/thioredoxin